MQLLEAVMGWFGLLLDATKQIIITIFKLITSL